MTNPTDLERLKGKKSWILSYFDDWYAYCSGLFEGDKEIKSKQE